MCAFNNIAYGISPQDCDERRLDRWLYFSTTGGNNLKTTVITCYCSVESCNPGLTYSRHLTYLANNKATINPNINCLQQIFGHDLAEFLHQLTSDGHQIILCGNFNSDYDNIQELLLQFGLSDIISEKHGACLKTYNQSKNAPLDIIFVSSHLQSKRCGYLSFGRLAGDRQGDMG